MSQYDHDDDRAVPPAATAAGIGVGVVLLIVGSVALAARSSPWRACEPPRESPAAFRVLVPAGRGEVVHGRLAGARHRLAQPRCGSVLTEFSDAAGQPLEQRLRELGFTPQGYLSQVLFEDGSGVRPCASSKVLAVTNPGSRVVFLCPEFVQVARRDPVEAELVLIHEVLHTLGLEEGPPSSQEITGRVEKRCRR